MLPIGGVLMVGCMLVAASAQSLPGIFGPATGVCGSETFPYGSSGSNATLQAFVAPASNCNPKASDTYAYALAFSGAPVYTLPGAGLRTIGTNISPAFGYYDTPALNLNSAQPVNSSSPLPVPAGVYDLMLNYTSNGNAQCGSASNTLPAAFIIQVQTTAIVTGQTTSASGSPSFALYVMITYPAGSLQLPFSDPASVAAGSVAFSGSSALTSALNGSASAVTQGPGYASFQLMPAQPLPAGQYTVIATYTPSNTASLVGSTSAPFSFTVTPQVCFSGNKSTANKHCSAPHQHSPPCHNNESHHHHIGFYHHSSPHDDARARNLPQLPYVPSLPHGGPMHDRSAQDVPHMPDLHNPCAHNLPSVRDYTPADNLPGLPNQPSPDNFQGARHNHSSSHNLQGARHNQSCSHYHQSSGHNLPCPHHQREPNHHL